MNKCRINIKGNCDDEKICHCANCYNNIEDYQKSIDESKLDILAQEALENDELVNRVNKPIAYNIFLKAFKIGYRKAMEE